MTSTFDASHAVKSGFLEKQGGQVKNWKRRYFIISQNALYYFKDKEQKEPQGDIPLIDATITDEECNDAPGFYFGIHFQTSSKAARKEYLLRAQTAEEREDWKKAIIHESLHTIFGKPLSQALLVNPNNYGQMLPIPYFIKSAIEYITTTSLDVEGVYRLNGSQSQIENLIKQIDSNKQVVFTDTHSTTGFIKTYMRSLPDMLFPKTTFQRLKSICALNDEPKQIDGIKSILRTLPLPNYIFLHYIFQHLSELIKHKDKTMMNERNLAVCFGPTMLVCDEDTTSGTYSESNVQQTIVILMITHFQEIFSSNPLIRYGSNTNGKMCSVSAYVANKYPYVLDAPLDAVVQVVSEDNDGWCICVYDNKWGVLHRTQLKDVTDPKVMLRGLAQQDSKWDLSPEEIEEMRDKCPGAIQLYEALRAKLNEYRGLAKKY